MANRQHSVVAKMKNGVELEGVATSLTIQRNAFETGDPYDPINHCDEYELIFHLTHVFIPANLPPDDILAFVKAFQGKAMVVVR